MTEAPRAPSTGIATIESIATAPVTWTSTRPAITPSDVRASVARWAASPASAGEPNRRDWRRRKAATPVLTTAEKAITAMPTPIDPISAPPVASRRTDS